LGAQLRFERAHRCGGLRELVPETFGLPDLKLVTQPDENDRVRDPRVQLQTLAQLHPALAVDLQRLARPIERQGQPLPLLRIWREASDQRLDLGDQRVAASIDRGTVERRSTVEALEAIAGEHRTKRSRNRDAPLGIEPRRDVRHEAVHTQHSTPARSGPARPTLSTAVRDCGIPWDYMGVNGSAYRPGPLGPAKQARRHGH